MMPGYHEETTLTEVPRSYIVYTLHYFTHYIVGMRISEALLYTYYNKI